LAGACGRLDDWDWPGSGPQEVIVAITMNEVATDIKNLTNRLVRKWTIGFPLFWNQVNFSRKMKPVKSKSRLGWNWLIPLPCSFFF
jgi:hypothetical protein